MMFNWLLLENFKCFQSVKLPLAPMTLLTGFNSAGKSSVLQALGVLHQTCLESEWSNELILNGSTVDLGAVKDVVNETMGGRCFKIGIETDNVKCTWAFEAFDRNSLTIPVQNIDWKAFHTITGEWVSQKYEIVSTEPTIPPLRNLLPQSLIIESAQALEISKLIHNLEYIGAERSGPRDIYPTYSGPDNKSVGIHGEFAPWMLYQKAEMPISGGLVLDEVQPTLQRQTEGWLRTFFPGVRLEINLVPRTNLVTMGLRMADHEEFRRPQNVGYGITHILPILTACLSASPRSKLIIENPEAHLHPSGQSLMGTFLARTAANGVQVVVETHSDHILNGIRKAVKNKIINQNDIAIHFFTLNAQVISPLVDRNGKLDNWPEGFFDQIDIDTTTLLGWSNS